MDLLVGKWNKLREGEYILNNKTATDLLFNGNKWRFILRKWSSTSWYENGKKKTRTAKNGKMQENG